VTEKGVGTAQLDPVAIRQCRCDLVENGERVKDARETVARQILRPRELPKPLSYQLWGINHQPGWK
jgi:hypothetical protein